MTPIWLGDDYMAIAGVIGLSMEVWPFVNEQFEVTVSHSLPPYSRLGVTVPIASDILLFFCMLQIQKLNFVTLLQKKQLTKCKTPTYI